MARARSGGGYLSDSLVPMNDTVDIICKGIVIIGMHAESVRA